MKRVIVFLFGVALSSILALYAVSVQAAPVAWESNQIREVSRAELQNGWPQASFPCHGSEQTVEVDGIGPRSRACVFGTSDRVRFVRYETGGTFRFAVAFPLQNTFYEVRNLCPTARCVYSSASDSLLLNHHLPQWRYGADLYRNVSKQLKRHFDVSTLRFYYTFEPERPADFTLKMGENEPAVEAMTFSDNGKWALLEMRSYGMVRLNVETLVARRVVAPGATYGLMNDPYFQLAITNDGKYTFATGYRAGFSMIKINDTCGDYLTADTQPNLYAHAYPCETIPIDTQTFFPSYFQGFNPKFNSDGTRLGISVHYYNNKVERVVFSPGDVAATDYIGLGDSYTSGEGELDDTFYKVGSNTSDTRCHVSVRGYPSLLKEAWRASGDSVACSGARMNDITSIGGYNGQSGFLAGLSSSERQQQKEFALGDFRSGVLMQSDFVAYYQPKSITVGVGGNDAGLIGKLTGCLGPGTCEWVDDPSKRYATAQEIKAIYPRLRETLQVLRTESPATRILVVGYPHIITPHPDAKCDQLTGALLNAKERMFIYESIKLLNEVVKAAASNENIPYVDISESLRNHELCGEKDASAMNGVRLGDDIAPIGVLKNFRAFGAESFHPTPKGHQLIAATIKQSYPTLPQAQGCNSCDIVSEPTPSSYWGDPTTSFTRQVEDPSITRDSYTLTSSLSIASRPMMFLPNSNVKATLHSEPIELGSATADAEGRFKLTLDSFPASVSPGYHVIHMFGTAPDGTMIDVYRTVAIEDETVGTTPQGVDLIPTGVSGNMHSGGQNGGGGSSSGGMSVTGLSGGTLNYGALQSTGLLASESFSVVSNGGRVAVESQKTPVASSESTESTHKDNNFSQVSAWFLQRGTLFAGIGVGFLILPAVAVWWWRRGKKSSRNQER